jgi:RNA polymerase sigma-70 factor (sigma-E family)
MAEWQAPPAFDEYVRTRHAGLLRFAHVLCGDPHLAADLVQDALERAGLAWRRIQRQDDPEGYVRRTIVNCFINHRRARRRERLVAEPPDRVEPPSPHRPADDEMWQLLATLPPQQRTVLVLRYYEDLSEAQIADILGCAIGTVKSNSSRAMAKLRTALGTPLESTEEGKR